MAWMKMTVCLHLNQLLTQALSNQIKGSSQTADLILLEAKDTLKDILKRLSHNSKMQQLLVELQTELCGMMVITENPNPKKYLIPIIRRVSEALEKQPKGENVETLVMVNMELSQALLDSSQEKLVSILSVLSKGIMWLCEDNEPFFELNDLLSQTLATKSEDRKLDLLFHLNNFLSIFMANDYQDRSTFRLVGLNHIASLAMKEKIEYPLNLFVVNLQLSQQMKVTSDSALLQELIELYDSLARIFLQRNIKMKYGQVIEWKLQLSKVMRKFARIPNETVDLVDKKTEGGEDISHENGETADKEKNISKLPAVVQKAIYEDGTRILVKEENNNEIKGITSVEPEPVQPNRKKEIFDEKEKAKKTKSETTSHEERVNAVGTNEVQVVNETVDVAEDKTRFMKVPGKFSRSKKDFMKTMHLPPVKNKTFRLNKQR